MPRECLVGEPHEPHESARYGYCEGVGKDAADARRAEWARLSAESLVPTVRFDRTCTCLPYRAGGHGPEIDCPVHGVPCTCPESWTSHGMQCPLHPGAGYEMRKTGDVVLTFAGALREWGARRLDGKVDRTTVTVEWASKVASDCDSMEVTFEVSGRVPNDGVRWATVEGYSMATLVRDLDVIASEQVSP